MGVAVGCGVGVAVGVGVEVGVAVGVGVGVEVGVAVGVGNSAPLVSLFRPQIASSMLHVSRHEQHWVTKAAEQVAVSVRFWQKSLSSVLLQDTSA